MNLIEIYDAFNHLLFFNFNKEIILDQPTKIIDMNKIDLITEKEE